MKIDTINYNFTFTAGKVQANREQLRSEVIKYLNLGKSVKEITGLVPVKESFIYRIIESLSLLSPKKLYKIRKRELNDLLKSRISDIAKEDFSIEKLSKEIGFSVKDINEWINSNLLIIRKESILERYKASSNAAEIAKEFNITTARAYQLRREFYANGSLEKPVISRRELIKKAILNGYSVKKICEIFNVTEGTVYKIKRTINKDEIYQPKKTAIFLLAKKGLKLSDIARRLNISFSQLKLFINKNNMKEELNNIKLQLHKDIFLEHQSGVPVAELTKKYSLSERTIYSIVKEVKSKI